MPCVGSLIYYRWRIFRVQSRDKLQSWLHSIYCRFTKTWAFLVSMYPLAKSTFKVVFKWFPNCFGGRWVTALRNFDFQEGILGIQNRVILRNFQLWPKFLVSYKIYMYANSCTNSVIFTCVFRHCGCYDTHSLIWCSVFNEVCACFTGNPWTKCSDSTQNEQSNLLISLHCAR